MKDWNLLDGYYTTLGKGKLPYQKWLYNQERAKREGNFIEATNFREHADMQCRDFSEGLRSLWEQYRRTKNQNTKWKIQAEASKLKRMKDRQCRLADELAETEKRAKEALLSFDPRIDVHRLKIATSRGAKPSYKHKMFAPRKGLRAKKGHFRKVLK